MAGTSASSQYNHLKNLWTDQHRQIQTELAKNHEGALKWLSHNVRNAAVGSMALGLSMNSPVAPMIATASDTLATFPTTQPESDHKKSTELSSNIFLLTELKEKVPHEVRPLTDDEEKELERFLSKQFGLDVKTILDGKRLNRNYGYIGAEQHLMRFPGDTIGSHFENTEDANRYARSGMAPGRGAWGYFTNSAQGLTKKDIEREKYYIAVQTFLSPGFMENVSEHYAFYKYRKMLVVNPDNGRAMVVVIGDAGPAQWTGKSLGGSPEVMDYLKRVDGSQKGPVLYFFIDDPDDTIPLGPINTI